jgi:malignant T-cell-amplified sequence
MKLESRTMRIYNLSKTARSDFMQGVASTFPKLDLKELGGKSKDLKIAELDNESVAIIFDSDMKLYFGRRGESEYFPLLKDQVILPLLSGATVDAGAVKFVCNGAKIMRPGIVSFSGNFSQGEIISIKEATHSKAIAVGRSLQDRQSLDAAKKGPAIDNLHYVGDKLWEALKGVET